MYRLWLGSLRFLFPKISKLLVFSIIRLSTRYLRFYMKKCDFRTFRDGIVCMCLVYQCDFCPKTSIRSFLTEFIEEYILKLRMYSVIVFFLSWNKKSVINNKHKIIIKQLTKIIKHTNKYVFLFLVLNVYAL